MGSVGSSLCAPAFAANNAPKRLINVPIRVPVPLLTAMRHPWDVGLLLLVL